MFPRKPELNQFFLQTKKLMEILLANSLHLNSLILKSAEIKDLRMRNDSLEKRISSLETTPNTTFALRKPSFSPTKSENTSSRTSNSRLSPDFTCKLNFDAVVTSLNGKNKEAFYTEFFILEESLDSIMRETDIEITTYPSITSLRSFGRDQGRTLFFSQVYKDI